MGWLLVYLGKLVRSVEESSAEKISWNALIYIFSNNFFSSLDPIKGFNIKKSLKIE
jgi:hypothetical protein